MLVYDASSEAAMNALTALLSGGFLALYSGSQPALDGVVTGTLLVTMSLSTPAFGPSTASGGIVTAVANAITSGVAVNTGTAGYAALLQSDNATVVGTLTVANSGAELNFTNTAVTAGVSVSLSALTITIPQT